MLPTQLMGALRTLRAAGAFFQPRALPSAFQGTRHACSSRSAAHAASAPLVRATSMLRGVRCASSSADGGVEPVSIAERKKVAVIGAGAIGLYYGARLQERGHDVSFVCRRDLEALRTSGLRVESVDGDMSFSPKELKVHASAGEIGEVDWVVLGLKTHALAHVGPLVRPCLGTGTRILGIMNGFGVEEEMCAHFERERVFGAMAFMCCNRGEPGSVLHTAYGGLQIGHVKDDPGEVARALRLFEGSRVEATGSESLVASRWQKLCWNLPFNGVACAMGGITVDKIVGQEDLRELARKVMVEVIRAANMDLAGRGVDRGLWLDEERIVHQMFAFTDTMGPYKPSTMIDLAEGRAMELEFMFDRPLRRAREAGARVPALEAVVAMVKAHGELRLLANGRL